MFIVEGFIIMLLLPVLVPYVLYLVVRNLNPFSNEARKRRYLKKYGELVHAYRVDKAMGGDDFTRLLRELEERYKDVY